MIEVKSQGKVYKILEEGDLDAIVKAVAEKIEETKKTLGLMEMANAKGRMVNIKKETDKEEQLIKKLMKEGFE